VPGIRPTLVLTPANITQLSDTNSVVVDFGQNFAGIQSSSKRVLDIDIDIPIGTIQLCMTSQSPPNVTIEMLYGELLYPNGSVNPLTSTAGQIKSGNGSANMSLLIDIRSDYRLINNKRRTLCSLCGGSDRRLHHQRRSEWRMLSIPLCLARFSLRSNHWFSSKSDSQW